MMDRGDIVWCDFDPSAGKEIQKTRPAVVVSPELFNRKFGFAIVVPITSTYRNWNTIIQLPSGLKTTGFVVAHQISTMDIKARNIRRSGESLDKQTLESVMRIVRAILN